MLLANQGIIPPKQWYHDPNIAFKYYINEYNDDNNDYYD